MLTVSRSVSAAPNASARALAVEGKPAATLVIPKEASDQEALAAREIQEWVRKMSGAELTIRRDDEEVDGNRVFVGDTKQAEALGLIMEKKATGYAGFRIKTAGAGVYITAESDLAVVDGACELLEKLGVRWYLPGKLGSVVPESPTVIVPELGEVQRPRFPMRWVGTGHWGYRNKCNRAVGGEGKRWGLDIRPGVYHGDYGLLPVKEYYDEHPEYFALINGARCGDKDTKLCVSNPEVAREVAKNMAKLLDEEPSIDLVGLSPTDASNYCECESCLKMDDEGERPADQKYSRRILLFYNAVARELAKTHPEARILAGAYDRYNQPPRDESIRAEPNLSLVICHYTEYCSMHEIEHHDCSRNERYLDLLEQWRKLIPDIYFYEYYWSKGFRELPCNLVHAIRKDIPLFARKGYKGLYTQYGSIWNTFLNYYIAAKLLWNVNADVDAILEEFYVKFFGRAAEPMKSYFELVDRSLDETELHLCTCAGGGTDLRRIFTNEVVNGMRRHCDKAMDLAQDELVKERLAKIDLAVSYTERFMDYLDDLNAASSTDDVAERREAAQRAQREIEALYEEVKAHRGRWSGIVSPDSLHWPHDLGRAIRVLDNSSKGGICD